jgi:two-component system response regulator MprA
MTPRSELTTSPIGSRKQKTKLLVVDDDERLLVALDRALSSRGFDVGSARGSFQALALLRSRWPQAMVLDIMMPGMDGLSLCRLVRETSTLPILMLTARDTVPDRVAGLQAGADDYLVKPFALDELVARLEALLRWPRPHSVQKSASLSYADVTLDPKFWFATRGTEPMSLTATEFRLLEHFLRNPQQVLTREQLIVGLWGEEYQGESNVVDVHVANLRQKLESRGQPRLIQTVRGVGYSLRAEE